MTISPTAEPPPRKLVRLWPGVAAVIVQWLLWFVLPVVAPEAIMVSVMDGVAGGLAVVVWWVFLSKHGRCCGPTDSASATCSWPGVGRRRPRSGSSAKPARNPHQLRRLRRQRRQQPSGPAFVGPCATAPFAACTSRPTGPPRRRSRCGAGRSDRAGRRSQSRPTFSTRRSSAVTTRSSPATTCPRAHRYGCTATQRGSGSPMAAPARARRRPSATAACTPSARPES